MKGKGLARKLLVFVSGFSSQMAKERKSRLVRLGRWVRLQALKVIRENSTPSRTGLGFALGSFIGIFPSFAVGTPIAFFLAGRFGWNRAAAVAGTFLMNPFTAPLFYSTSTWLGMEILGQDMDLVPVEGLLNYVRHFGLAFLVGNTLFALLFASAVGVIIFLAARRHRRFEPQELQLDLQAEPVTRVNTAATAGSDAPPETAVQYAEVERDDEAKLPAGFPAAAFSSKGQPPPAQSEASRLSA